MKQKVGLIKISGYILLTISCLLFILIPAVPWFNFSAVQKGGITAGLIIAGEITFYLSIFILGRSFYEKIRNRLRFRRSKENGSDK